MKKTKGLCLLLAAASLIFSLLFGPLPSAMAAGAAVACPSPASLYRGVASQTAGNLTITEVAAGDLSVGTITLGLPSGVTFSGAQTASVSGDIVLVNASAEVSFDGRTATWTMSAISTAASTISVTPRINLDATVLDGDLLVAAGGTAGATAASLKVANVSGAGAASSCASPTNLFRGASNGAAGTLIITENGGGALVNGGTITATLPSGVTFYTAPSASVLGADITLSAPVLTGGNLATWTVTRNSSTGAASVEISSRLNIDPAYGGSDIKVGIAGTASVTAADVKIANIVAAGTINSCPSPTNLIRGSANQTAGTLTIAENAPATLLGGGTITITLPDGATFTTAPTASLSSGGLTLVNTLAALSNGDRTATWTVSAVSMASSTISITPKITLSGTIAYGDLKATVGGTAGATPADIKIATVISGATGTTNSCASPTTVYKGKTGQAGGAITIVENGPVILRSDKTITITLPSGVTFASVPIVTLSSGNLALVSNTASLSGSDSVANWTVRTESTTATTLTISPSLNLSSNASLGDLKVYIGGTAGATSGYLKIATIKSDATGTTNSCSSPSNLIQGVTNQAAAYFTIAENAAKVLKTDKTIVVTLPKGATFASAPTTLILSGNIILKDATATLSGSDTTATWTVKTPSTTASTIKIISKITLDSTIALGDLKVKVSGTAGVTEGDLKIGTVVAASTGTTNTCLSYPVLVKGGSNQAVGTIKIKENGLAVLKVNKTLTITLPSGASFANAPVASIYSGNITLVNNTAALSSSDTIATWTIKTESTTASTISIAPKINLTATFATGDLKATIGGGAGATSGVLKIGSVDVMKQSIFVIGDSTYKVGGKTYMMDTACYTSGGRTFVPVRYLAYAIGLDEGDIGWNPRTLMVTLVKDGTTVKLIIGSKYLIKNNTMTTMDVKAATKNGRTVLPFRWVVEAFGAKVGWNGALSRVTVEYI
ncbi:MAG: copper amine oxidase N-terminal domain-containing protein [Actinomycetota bacterium]|nr:copper amine oxidase N-terminal domain-containing protein [Actinomycetota bacterium]